MTHNSWLGTHRIQTFGEHSTDDTRGFVELLRLHVPIAIFSCFYQQFKPVTRLVRTFQGDIIEVGKFLLLRCRSRFPNIRADRSTGPE